MRSKACTMETPMKLTAATMIALLGLGCAGRVLDTTEQDRAGGGGGGTENVASDPGVSTNPNLPSEAPGEAGAPDAAAGAYPAGRGGGSSVGGKPAGGGKSAGGAGIGGRGGDANGDAGEAGVGGVGGDAGEGAGAAGIGGSAGEANGGAGGSGLGGSAGTGGFAPAPKCTSGLTFVPSTPLITDTFNSVAAPGVLYHYTAPGLTPAVTEILPSSSGAFGGIHIKAEPGVATDSANQWFGVGLPLYGCVDATAYRGVQFTISGDLGSCALTFGLVTSVNNSDSFVGSCQASLCLAASSAPLAVGTTVVLFADMAGGVPESNVNPATLNDLQWQFTLPVGEAEPACVADFTITNVSFVN